jgi:hypothetical protein
MAKARGVKSPKSKETIKKKLQRDIVALEAFKKVGCFSLLFFHMLVLFISLTYVLS